MRNFEFRYRCRTGEIGYGLMSASIIEIDGIDCIISEATDITDRKRAEEALQASETILRLLSTMRPLQSPCSIPR